MERLAPVTSPDSCVDSFPGLCLGQVSPSALGREEGRVFTRWMEDSEVRLAQPLGRLGAPRPGGGAVPHLAYQGLTLCQAVLGSVGQNVLEAFP